MAEVQLTHIALVGARIECFRPYGFNSREELLQRKVIPEPGASPAGSLREQLRRELPIWIHNIINDRDFPQRERLLMPLRRFEGELRDNRNNEAISTVLQYGFASRQLDPCKLPPEMSVRQRCAIVAHIGPWRDAFGSLQDEVVELLAGETTALGAWCDSVRRGDCAATG